MRSSIIIFLVFSISVAQTSPIEDPITISIVNLTLNKLPANFFIDTDFGDLSNVRKVNMTFISVEEIEEGAFNGLENIQEFYFEHSDGIDDLTLLNTMRNIEQLSLKCDGLNYLHEDVLAVFPRLKYLNLRDNDFDYIVWDLENVTVEFLDISRSPLMEINLHSNNLAMLNLQGSLSEDTDVELACPKLKMIDIQYNFVSLEFIRTTFSDICSTNENLHIFFTNAQGDLVVNSCESLLSDEPGLGMSPDFLYSEQGVVVGATAYYGLHTFTIAIPLVAIFIMLSYTLMILTRRQYARLANEDYKSLSQKNLVIGAEGIDVYIVTKK